MKSDNNILFIGMGVMAIGLVTTFVGLGDKGFKTFGLKLIGPSLVGVGVLLAIFRMMLCLVRVPVQKRKTNISSLRTVKNQDDEETVVECETLLKKP